MAGAPYEAGGIAGHDRGHAGRARRRAAGARPRAAGRRRCAAGITHQEIKSGYGLTVESEARLCRARRAAHRRRHLPRRPRGPAGVRGARRRVRRARLRPDARGLRARTAAGSTSSASAAPSTPSSRGRCWRRGARRASACACTATSSARGRGCGRGRDGRGLGRPLHLPRGRRHRGAGGERDGRHLPARRPTSRPASPIPTPGGRSTPASSVAIATNTNPGSSYTTSMAFCIALAVREMGMTIDEAVAAATRGRRPGAAPRRRRPARAGRPGRRASILDAPSHGAPGLSAGGAAGAPGRQGSRRSQRSTVFSSLTRSATFCSRSIGSRSGSWSSSV